MRAIGFLYSFWAWASTWTAEEHPVVIVLACVCIIVSCSNELSDYTRRHWQFQVNQHKRISLYNRPIKTKDRGQPCEAEGMSQTYNITQRRWKLFKNARVHTMLVSSGNVSKKDSKSSSALSMRSAYSPMIQIIDAWIVKGRWNTWGNWL